MSSTLVRSARLLLPALLVASSLFAQGASEPPSGAPKSATPALEPYRFNARERTVRGLAEWERGQPEAAVEPLDSALRLRPDDPLTLFNAGTAHLGAKRPDAAALLEKAAKGAPPELAADALYNLGNARLGAEDAKGAIDAYKGALKSRSDFAEAKRNLELAVRLLEQQQEQQKQQQQQQNERQNEQQKQQQKPQGQEGDSKDQSSDSSGQESRSGEKPPEQNRDPKSSEQEPQSNGGQQGSQGDSERPQQNRPLPQFEDQQDMSAEQAAAILQAVENLERQQRRDQARAAAKAKTSVEKDW